MVTRRSSNFELLRIFAMFMIVACHYAVHGIRHVLLVNTIQVSGGVFKNLFTSLLTPGGDIGNGVFFLLTGYFLYGKEYNPKRLINLVSEVYFYAITILLLWITLRVFHVCSFPELRFNSQLLLFINAILPISSGPWWFIQAYVILFLLIPIINLFLVKLSNRSFFAVVLFIFFFWYLSGVFAFYYVSLELAVFFYVLGAYLKISDFRLNMFISLALFILLWFVLSFVDYKLQFVNINENTSNKLLEILYKSFIKICTVLSVITLFAFFKSLKIGYVKIINIIAATTFGIYLFHDSSIGRILIWNNIFHCSDIQYNSDFYPLFAFGTIAIVFVACSFIDYLRQCLIAEKLNRLFNNLIDRISRL